MNVYEIRYDTIRVVCVYVCTIRYAERSDALACIAFTDIVRDVNDNIYVTNK